MNENVSVPNLKFDLNIGNEPLVSVGIVNCNRLYYLKSCLESFLECTEDYKNKEIIVVDNASTEEGTEDYLQDLESRGHRVIRMVARDPSNEFAKGLNTVVRETSGEYVVILQGDMQFTVRNGWLKEYVDLYKANPGIGCITFDAQRAVTNQRSQFSNTATTNKFKFVADISRPPTSGAGDVMYSREVLNALGPWAEKNDQHEYTGDSETKMLQRVSQIKSQVPNLPWIMVMPWHPVAIAIYTDSRGTNARIRGYRRYGDYWAPRVENTYYEIKDIEDVFALEDYDSRNIPYSIEEVAVAAGDWTLPIDAAGAWMKNPIRPEEAVEGEWTDLPRPTSVEALPEEASVVDDDHDNSYLDEWED